MLRNVSTIIQDRKDGTGIYESRVLTSRLGCGGGLHTPQSFPESIYSRFTGVDEKKRKHKGPLNFLL